MTIQKRFTMSIDDMVLPRYRFMEVIGTIKTYKLSMAGLVAIISAVMFFLADMSLFVVLPFFVIVTVHFLLTTRKYLQKKLRKHLKAMLGSSDTLDVDLTIDDEGISLTASGQTNACTWETVAEATETPEYYEFILEPKGVIVLYKKFFKDESEHKELQEFIRGKVPTIVTQS